VVQKLTGSTAAAATHAPASSTTMSIRCDVPTAAAGVLALTYSVGSKAANTPVILARYKSSVAYKPVSNPPSTTTPIVFSVAKLSIQVPLHAALTAVNSKYQVGSVVVQISLGPLLGLKAPEGGATSIGQLQYLPKQSGQFNSASRVVQFIHRPTAGQTLPSMLEFQAQVQLCTLASEGAAANAATEAPKAPTSLPGIVKFSLSKALPSCVSIEVEGAAPAVATEAPVVIARQSVEYSCAAEYKFL
jgi:hypothetical protein